MCRAPLNTQYGTVQCSPTYLQPGVGLIEDHSPKDWGGGTSYAVGCWRIAHYMYYAATDEWWAGAGGGLQLKLRLLLDQRWLRTYRSAMTRVGASLTADLLLSALLSQWPGSSKATDQDRSVYWGLGTPVLLYCQLYASIRENCLPHSLIVGESGRMRTSWTSYRNGPINLWHRGLLSLLLKQPLSGITKKKSVCLDELCNVFISREVLLKWSKIILLWQI